MKRIIVTGSNGQIGVELVPYLREIYGAENVLATARRKVPGTVSEGGPFELLEVRDGKTFSELIGNFKADAVVHLAGILSARGEACPQESWDINAGGCFTALECAREHGTAFFFPQFNSGVRTFDACRQHTPGYYPAAHDHLRGGQGYR